MAALFTSWSAVKPLGRHGCILEVIERITQHAQDTAKQLNVFFQVKNVLKFKLIRFEP